MSTRPSLTPLADLGRSAGQAPLHGVRAAGIGAAGDDAEIGAGLLARALYALVPRPRVNRFVAKSLGGGVDAIGDLV